MEYYLCIYAYQNLTLYFGTFKTLNEPEEDAVEMYWYKCSV